MRTYGLKVALICAIKSFATDIDAQLETKTHQTQGTQLLTHEAVALCILLFVF